MGKVEERCRVDCIAVCEENLIWFEGMPVVVGYEKMTEESNPNSNVQNNAHMI